MVIICIYLILLYKNQAIASCLLYQPQKFTWNSFNSETVSFFETWTTTFINLFDRQTLRKKCFET
jgi:hypothetical protein